MSLEHQEIIDILKKRGFAKLISLIEDESVMTADKPGRGSRIVIQKLARKLEMKPEAARHHVRECQDLILRLCK